MQQITIKGTASSSTILVGESIAHLPKYLPQSKVIIITDTHVNALYNSYFNQYPIIEIGVGEEHKTLDTLAYIYEQLIEMEVDRTAFLVGIGGGIVTDVTGFVASTYLRGVRFGFVSTTLLAQVDASVGGKNGVNLNRYKNMVGVFNQPEFVICDMTMLQTLPAHEVKVGFAEIIKHAFIKSRPLFDYLVANYDKALGLDAEVIEKLVYDSVVIKANVVNQDEKEKGERRKLNFGHTLGHAVEKTAQVSHGEAVSIGMGFATALSVEKGLLDKATAQQIFDLIRLYQLPLDISMDKEKVIEALIRDKKRESAFIHFVLLTQIGEAVVEKIAIDELKTVITKY